MNDQAKKNELESILTKYLTTSDSDEADGLLSQLIEGEIKDQIEGYFHRRISTQNDHSSYRFTKWDAEDQASQTVVELTDALTSRRQFPTLSQIEDLQAFTAAICRGVYSDFWRRRFKEYIRLKNRIRYLLRSRAEMFRSIRDGRQLIKCFLEESPERKCSFSVEEITELVIELHPDFPVLDEASLLRAILENTRGWVELTDLVEIMARLRGIKDIPPGEVVIPDNEIDGMFSEGDENAMHANRFELQFLWFEIRELPRFQKLALIYNLRDERGQELNCVWFEAGIATLSELATQFGTDEQGMASLLPELPFSDKRIADVLGIEEDGAGDRRIRPEVKVSNLRKVARENLQRRRDGKERRRRE